MPQSYAVGCHNRSENAFELEVVPIVLSFYRYPFTKRGKPSTLPPPPVTSQNSEAQFEHNMFKTF